MKTIVDILRKGNQELFHSAIIAWLLDPSAEHGLGPSILEEFARLVASRGGPALQQALAGQPAAIRTEVGVPGARYDISMDISGAPIRFIIENKTKSVGQMLHLTRYEGTGVCLIPLGFCDVSFTPEVYRTYPVVEYGDILEILKSLPIPEGNDFGVLVKHYRRFLERELSLLKIILDCFREGELAKHSELLARFAEVPGRTRNDERFMNLYYIEHLRRRFMAEASLAHVAWNTEKNQISGVWMASDGLASHYAFSDELQALCTRCGAEMWFHIELWQGVLARELHDVAGMIQLRCSSQQPSRAFLVELYSLTTLRANQYKPSQLKTVAGSFYGVGQNFMKRDLRFEAMTRLVLDFMRQFGAFQRDT
jgi:hypothetical protein